MTALPAKIIPVILAGGVGSRLWPTSTPDLPKQFIPLKAGGTSFQNAVERVKCREIFDSPIIICDERHRGLVASIIDEKEALIICEPIGRNTAPASCIGALAAQQIRGTDSLILILPADHYIPDLDIFEQAVLDASANACAGHIMCFGLEPQFANTEFGYIELGDEIGTDSFRVKKFTEKPDLDVANHYLKSKEYVWNTGIYMAQSELLLKEMAKFHPDIFNASEQSWKNVDMQNGYYLLREDDFSKCPKISIDYAVMEHTDKASVQIVDFEWRDLGGWDALLEFDTVAP